MNLKILLHALLFSLSTTLFGAATPAAPAQTTTPTTTTSSGPVASVQIPISFLVYFHKDFSPVERNAAIGPAVAQCIKTLTPAVATAAKTFASGEPIFDQSTITLRLAEIKKTAHDSLVKVAQEQL